MILIQPIPRLGKVLGLIGKNGVGKTTALKILGGKVKPNLGNYENPPEWQEIIKNYRGSELQNYLAKLTEDKIAVRRQTHPLCFNSKKI